MRWWPFHLIREGGHACACAPQLRQPEMMRSQQIHTCLSEHCPCIYLSIHMSVHLFQAVNHSQFAPQKTDEKAGKHPEFMLHKGSCRWWLHMEFQLYQWNGPISKHFHITWLLKSKGMKLQITNAVMSSSFVVWPPWVIKKNLFNFPTFAAQLLVLPIEEWYQIMCDLFRKINLGQVDQQIRPCLTMIILLSLKVVCVFWCTVVLIFNQKMLLWSNLCFSCQIYFLIENLMTVVLS